MSDFDLGTKNLRLERDGPILWCTIDRPHARNALTPSMYFGIKKAVHLVNADKDLRALILTGTGDVFAPGGDLGGRYEQEMEEINQTASNVYTIQTIIDTAVGEDTNYMLTVECQ